MANHNLDSYVIDKINTNVIKMLTNRGEDIKKLTRKTNHMYIKDRLYIRFILTTKVKPNEIKQHLEKIIEKKLGLEQIILVIYKSPNNSILKIIKPFKKEYDIQIFTKDELIIDKINHHLVPKHILIQKQEIIDDILDKYQIKSIHKLPFILSNDPISKYYNAKKGNLFRIERNSVTSGKYITYRCVY